MQDTDYPSLVTNQRQYFATGSTLPLSFRIEQLKKLKSLIEKHESDIVSALKKDLNKPPMEAVIQEILFVTKEISFTIKHLHQWMRKKKVSTPFVLWPATSEIYFEPYGSVLIIAPWNYPFMLSLSPLVGAMSAGNCAIIKPSEISVNTQEFILKLINDHFPSDYIHAIHADAEETHHVLQEKFDYIFFTGSPQIGKQVMEAAAKNLTPLTLELGGKNPCIVDETANLSYAARRIAWAKTTNAGQVCLSPDYLYIHQSCKDEFVNQLKVALKQFYGDQPEKSQDYGRIISQKHFDRIKHLMTKGKILSGGETCAETRYIAPTLIDQVSWDDPIMQEEIFGPLLPIFTYDKMEDVINTLKSRPKSLALYLFSQHKENKNKILRELSFGGGCINDCIVQIANLQLPFGGVGRSGLGHYHGQYSFETFSHSKAIYNKSFSLDVKLQYPPYTTQKLKWLRQLFKL